MLYPSLCDMSNDALADLFQERYGHLSSSGEVARMIRECPQSVVGVFQDNPTKTIVGGLMFSQQLRWLLTTGK